MRNAKTLVASLGLLVMLAVAAAWFSGGGFPSTSEDALAANDSPVGVICGNFSNLRINSVAIPGLSGIVLARIDQSGTTVTLTPSAYTNSLTGPAFPSCKVAPAPVPAGTKFVVNPPRPSVTGTYTAGTKTIALDTCQFGTGFGGLTPPGWSRTQSTFAINTAAQTMATFTLRIPTTSGVCANIPSGTQQTQVFQIDSTVNWLDSLEQDGSIAAFNSDWDGDGCLDWDELDPDDTNPDWGDPLNPNDCTATDYSGVYNVQVTATAMSKAVNGDGTYNIVPGSMFHCISRLDHNTGDDTISNPILCYTDAPATAGGAYQAYLNRQDGIAGAPPPPPYGFGELNALAGQVVRNQANFKVTVPALANNANQLEVYATPVGSVKSVTVKVQDVYVPALPAQCGNATTGVGISRVKAFPANQTQNDPVNSVLSKRAIVQFPAKCFRPGDSVDIKINYVGAAPTLQSIRWLNNGAPLAANNKAGNVPALKTKPVVNIAGCFDNVDGSIGPAVYTEAAVDGDTLEGGVDIYLGQDSANCNAGTPIGAALPATLQLAPQPAGFDHDGDGCTDSSELDPTPARTGRDPYNPYDCDSDYYNITNVLTTAAAQNRCKNQLPEPPCAGDPDGTVVPGAYFNCIADNQSNGGTPGTTIRSRLYCYIDIPGIDVNAHVAGVSGDGLGGIGPPPPFGEVHNVHTELTGTITGSSIATSGCFATVHGILGPNIYVRSTINGATGTGTVDIFNNRTDCTPPPPGCTPSAAPPITNCAVPVQTSEQGKAMDSDGDNCSDKEELGNVASQGGLRDPYNWGDFMSVHTGPLSNLAKDQVVSVADISAIVARFGTNDSGGTTKINRNTNPKLRPTGTIYHPSYDRGGPIPFGASPGALSRQNPATTGSGAGSITIADISAAVTQFGQSCAAAP